MISALLLIKNFLKETFSLVALYGKACPYTFKSPYKA